MKSNIKKKLKQSKKAKSRKLIYIGTRKKSVFFLWLILIISILFSIYKNFTTTNREIIRETRVIEEKIVDTRSIEIFTTDFINDFYSWKNTKDGLRERTEKIQYYLTESLQQMNLDMIRGDVPTSSLVRQIKIWDIQIMEKNCFSVVYSVVQEIKENKEITTVSSDFRLEIYKDEANNLVIVKNPIAWKVPTRSNYNLKNVKKKSEVNPKEQKEIKLFLETFFKMYPSINKEELIYFSENNKIPIINNKKLEFLELEIQNFEYMKEKIKINVVAKYLDNRTKAILFMDYNLIMKKERNWIIKEMN